MECNPKIIFWNVRGLNSGAKHAAVRSVISSDRPAIICLQETKLELFTPPLVSETLGPAFDAFLFLPGVGTCGGILLVGNMP